MKGILLLIVAQAFAVIASGQTAGKCMRYAILMAEAKRFEEASDFIAALNKYNSAQTHCRENAAEVQVKINAMFVKINNLRTVAEEATKAASISAELAEKELNRSKLILSRLYFFEHKYALMTPSDQNPGYYFIDTTGAIVGGLGFWQQAEPFDHLGLAKVVYPNTEGVWPHIFLDGDQKRYSVFYGLADLKRNKDAERATALDLRESKSTAIEGEIPQFKDLKVLRLNALWAGILKYQMENFNSLRYLDLSNCGLTAVDTQFLKATNLVSLDISGNGFTTLPPGLGALTSLTTLNLGGNALNELPEEIFSLKNLRSLRLKDTRLKPGELDRIFRKKPRDCEVVWDVPTPVLQKQ